MLIRQFGGDVVNSDGTQATYNSPQGVQAAQYIHDLKAKTTPQEKPVKRRKPQRDDGLQPRRVA